MPLNSISEKLFQDEKLVPPGKLSGDLIEWRKAEFLISTDPNRLSIDTIHDFLTHSYWARGRRKETVEKSIQHSLNFGLYHSDKQIGFARVLSDFVSIAYLLDVFILEAYRHKGFRSLAH